MADVDLSASVPRRTPPREVRNLEAQVLAVLIAEPRLTRSGIASKLGVDLARIGRPVTNLLHAGRIVREGHKSETRYRPHSG